LSESKQRSDRNKKLGMVGYCSGNGFACYVIHGFVCQKGGPDPGKHTSQLGSKWEFPGGKVEKGETLPDCLSREISEELGIMISEPVPFFWVDHKDPTFDIRLGALKASIVGGELHPQDHDEVTWPHGISHHPIKTALLTRVVGEEVGEPQFFPRNLWPGVRVTPGAPLNPVITCLYVSYSFCNYR